MTQTVDIYIAPAMKIGSATATSGSASLTSFVDVNVIGWYGGGKTAFFDGLEGVDVLVQSVTGSNATGKAHKTRIITDNGATLILSDKHPFAD